MSRIDVCAHAPIQQRANVAPQRRIPSVSYGSANCVPVSEGEAEGWRIQSKLAPNMRVEFDPQLPRYVADGATFRR